MLSRFSNVQNGAIIQRISAVDSRWWAALLIAGVLGVYGAGLTAPFQFDDVPNLVENTAIHLSEWSLAAWYEAAVSFQPGGGSRPLAMLSFAFDHWRAGLNPVAFRTTNLYLHGLAVVAALALLHALLAAAGWCERRAWGMAIAATILWALHPLQVSTVLYIVQRMQMLAGLFLLLALWMYVQGRRAQIAGEPSWRWWLGFWAAALAALASKEDAVILPAITLLFELFVLRFAAATGWLARAWRWGYLLGAAAGGLLYVFWLLPTYGSWTPYPGRDFSAWERVLSQGRVLWLYLSQIFWPLPERLAFYYDAFPVSRGWWQPPTTLLSWVGVGGLLAAAWFWRHRAPLVALGVFWFFAGHFITSNALNLELVFEHRNYFPLLGMTLAVVVGAEALLCHFSTGWRWALVAATVLVLGGLTLWRALVWADPVAFAHFAVRTAPDSARAWNALCTTTFEQTGRNPEHPGYRQVIAVCEEGWQRTQSAAIASNLILFKTLHGSVGAEDWQRFYKSLSTITMGVEARRTIRIMLGNVGKGFAIDPEAMVEALRIMEVRGATFSPEEWVEFAYFVLLHTPQPDAALPLFERAFSQLSKDDPWAHELLEELRARGRERWAERLAQRMLSGIKP